MSTQHVSSTSGMNAAVKRSFFKKTADSLLPSVDLGVLDDLKKCFANWERATPAESSRSTEVCQEKKEEEEEGGGGGGEKEKDPFDKDDLDHLLEKKVVVPRKTRPTPGALRCLAKNPPFTVLAAMKKQEERTYYPPPSANYEEWLRRKEALQERTLERITLRDMRYVHHHCKPGSLDTPLYWNQIARRRAEK